MLGTILAVTLLIPRGEALASEQAESYAPDCATNCRITISRKSP